MPTTNRAAVLSWCGAAISPFLIYSVLLLHLDPVTSVILFLLGLGALTGALRRQPAAVLGVLVFVLAVVALDGDRGALQLWIEVVLTVVILGVVGLLAAVRRRRVSVTGTVLALTAGLLLIAAEKSFAMVSLSVAVVLATITAWVIGDSIRQRTRFAAAQRVQSEAAAVESERLRIARELHDMIAHSIGVIAIQAGMGRRMIGTQPAAAQEALAAIEDTSRETLAALRRMLGTLRRSGPGPGGAVALAPAPGLADLDSLVTRTRDAGVRVEIEWLGTHHPLPPDVDLSAFRIVQESLTNVIRHSGARHCTVVLNRTGDNLTIEITDDGTASPSGPRPSLAPASPPTHGPITPPGLGPASAPGRAPAPASSFRAGAGGGLAGTDHAFTDLTGTDRHLAGPTGADRGLAGPNEIGHGLTGMRERVTLLAGEFSAGPRPAGGFRVTVRIPVPA